jgi:hypothetical protein
MKQVRIIEFEADSLKEIEDITNKYFADGYYWEDIFLIHHPKLFKVVIRAENNIVQTSSNNIGDR